METYLVFNFGEDLLKEFIVMLLYLQIRDHWKKTLPRNDMRTFFNVTPGQVANREFQKCGTMAKEIFVNMSQKFFFFFERIEKVGIVGFFQKRTLLLPKFYDLHNLPHGSQKFYLINILPYYLADSILLY